MKSTVWCLLNALGEVVETGKSPTTAVERTGLIQRLARDEALELEGRPARLRGGRAVSSGSILVKNAHCSSGFRRRISC